MPRCLIAIAVLAAACGTELPPAPYPGASPAAYVAKVKDLLVGQPPTDAEIAQVVKDPTALGTLVDGWMQLPAYRDKMKVFFELAFQQTQITAADFIDIIPPQGIGLGRDVPLLVQNATESFARTALELIDEGRPLTDAFTTHRVMMTPALVELYAFLDARRVADDGTITDAFARAHPGLPITLETAGGPIPIAQTLDPTSANYMHWYTPDLPGATYPANPACNGLDPITLAPSAYGIHELLFGEIPPHKAPDGTNCPGRTGSSQGPQLLPSDFTTWKMVTIRPPMPGEATTAFYDLPALRSATELVIGTPHPGFFTTPAFFANWPTNTSNQMRVTLNQALIVATGAQVDGTDATTPPSTPGLDTQHASQAACVACHQTLDPTRSILSKTYSYYYYPQSDPALEAQPGLFAFRGVVAPQQTIDDFAKLLATHPLVPQAWAEKLCYYLNSAPCDPSDPAFQKIVADFAQGFSWNQLVRELATSPITTNAAPSVTVKNQGETIAVARRDHLCAALNQRLGFVDICGLDLTLGTSHPPSASQRLIEQVVSGLPSDGYGRGATIPVLPNQPTLFYRSGLENICEAVAEMTIDAPPDPAQPGATHWSSGDPDTAIAAFVSTIMGLTASDPRAAPATAALHDHFIAAGKSGETAADALRSTFTAACLSPSFIGIGM